MVTMTEAIHAGRGTKTMTQHVADESLPGETNSQCVGRLQDTIDNPVAPPAPAAGEPTPVIEEIEVTIEAAPADPDITTMSVDELRAYASANSIDLGRAKSRDKILAIIEG